MQRKKPDRLTKYDSVINKYIVIIISKKHLQKLKIVSFLITNETIATATMLSCFNLCHLYSRNKMSYLDSIEYNDTVEFVPPITSGKVVKVYDGDTITIASKLPGVDAPVYRFHVRLNGIDTPEIKGKTNAEKDLAKKARDSLFQLILHKIVTLRNVSTEKYGRILADVYLGDLHVNAWMIEHGYAVRYDGGTKLRPAEWDARI